VRDKHGLDEPLAFAEVREEWMIDVIVPVYNNWKMTEECIHHALEASSVPMRIILIDNGSEEKQEVAWNIPAPHALLIIRSDLNLGFVKAINMGLARSTAPYVVFLNNDTFCGPGIFDRMIEVLSVNLQCGCVGVISSSGAYDIKRVCQDLPDNITSISERQAYLTGKCQKKTSVTSIVAFFCAMLPREAIKKAGYLSERYNMGLGDDNDYCRRLKSLGYETRLAWDCYCEHHQRTTFKSKFTPKQIAMMQAAAMTELKSSWGKI